MPAKTRSSSKKDFLALLPKEIVLLVFGYLEPGSLLKASQASKTLRKLGEDDLLWKTKCEKEGLGYCLNSQNEEALKRWSKKNSFVYSPWKASFLKPYRVQKNFRTKKPKVVRVEKCHFQNFRLSVLDNKVVSISSDVIYISCALTGKTLHDLVGHTSPVMDIQMRKDLIISCSLDTSVRVWNMDSGECVHVLLGHTRPVLCLHLHGGVVDSGSRDATLRMWDVKGGQCLRTLTGHEGSVNCVQYNGSLVVSGSDDKRVKVWDAGTGECLRTFTDHASEIRALKVDGVHVVSSDAWNIIKIRDVNCGVLKNTLINYAPTNLEVHDNLLVGYNNLDQKWKIWNVLTSSHLQTLDTVTSEYHHTAKKEIQFNGKFVVNSTGKFDGKVKLWDVKTADFIRDLFLPRPGGKVVKIWLEDAKIVCALELFRLDPVSNRKYRNIKIVVLNFDMNDVK